MKVGRFGLGFKSVFHLTGKVNTFRVRERFSLLIKISGPEKLKKKKSRDQSSPTSALGNHLSSTSVRRGSSLCDLLKAYKTELSNQLRESYYG